MADGFIWRTDPEDETGAVYWRVILLRKKGYFDIVLGAYTKNTDLLENFLGAYVAAGHTTWRKMIVAIDFSDL